MRPSASQDGSECGRAKIDLILPTLLCVAQLGLPLFGLAAVTRSASITGMRKGRIVKVIMHAGFERPTITFYLAATAEPAVAVAAVKAFIRADWTVEDHEEAPPGMVERYALKDGHACPLLPP